jgi:hypothetical protein
LARPEKPDDGQTQRGAVQPLPKSQFENFLKMRRRLKEKQAVLINGGKYSLSYRLPFPNLR